MLGYMTAAQAKAEGFTHSGSYYGIPVWMTLGETPTVATKWYPLEYLMPVISAIEGLVRSVRWPNDEPTFMFKVGDQIEELLHE